jgi:ABC-type transport system involved in multi-copper enzyme maturation permease subunit
MIVALRQIGAISKITMLEGARKQIFHVLMLVAMTLIAVSTTLAVFDHNIDVKVVKDLCLVAILVSISIIAITMSVSGVPSEIESKTVYPVLAKPMARWKFIVGKYAGTMGTVAIGMAILFASLCAILLMFVGKIDPGVLFVIPYLLLEAAILAAVAMCLSTVTSPALAWFLAIVIYICGNVKFALYDFLRVHDHTFIGAIWSKAMYSVLPNLECFNFKDSIVHSVPVPPIYLVQTAAYGLLYIAFMLTLASIIFERREL